MISYSIKGFYGSGKTKCTVYVHQNFDGSCWYVVEGSTNVNKTMQTIEDGVNVEEISDFMCFTASEPVNSIEDLANEIFN